MPENHDQGNGRHGKRQIHKKEVYLTCDASPYQLMLLFLWEHFQGIVALHVHQIRETVKSEMLRKTVNSAMLKPLSATIFQVEAIPDMQMAQTFIAMTAAHLLSTGGLGSSFV